MDRRALLRGLGAATGLGILGVGGGLAAIQPRRGWLVPPGTGASTVDGSPHVVVIGGGLAGISAATELAARGCRVTLLERAPQLGGKVAGWDVAALGETFPVEHGFHGFFSQYYNLRELLGGAGVDPADLAPQDSYPVLLPDGPPERFRNTTAIWPFNLASVIAGSARLHPLEFRDADGLLDLMRFRGEETFAAFDDVDFATWIAARRIPRAMVDVVLRPFGDATLNRIERLSAAEAIRFFHFYFLGNPEGMAFSALARDSATAVIAPLRRRLEALGVDVRTGTSASRLVRDGDRIAAVELGSGATGTVRIASADLGTDLRAWGGVLAARRPEGIVAFDARCTHMGCPVRPAGDGLACPCHGGRFDADGRPVAGPPKAPLRRLPASESDGTVVVGSAGAVAEVLRCDHVVLACEVRGARALVAASDLDPAWSARVLALGESEPYAVARWWLDRPTDPGRPAFATTTGFRHTDALALYSAFQQPYVDWSRRTGGSVVEAHAYAVPPEDLADADTLAAAMLAEVRGMLPELADARVLHAEARLQDDFTRFAPGDHATRPPTATPHPNLWLAGDHVRIEAPVFLMEAAVVSGRLAANGVLAACSAAPVPIPTVPPAGVLA